MKRLFDLTIVLVLGVVLLPVAVVIGALIRLTSPGPALYWSSRVGRGNQLFQMAKFRTMRCGAPQLATHLLTDSRSWITPLGRWLRRTSLDELPQLWNVLRGDMSLVGPRPALFNQEDLIELRSSCGVHELTPGLTGWAQINGRDELSIPEKVQLDFEYLQRRSVAFDAWVLLLTFLSVVRRDGVRQADDAVPQRGVPESLSLASPGNSEQKHAA